MPSATTAPIRIVARRPGLGNPQAKLCRGSLNMSLLMTVINTIVMIPESVAAVAYGQPSTNTCCGAHH